MDLTTANWNRSPSSAPGDHCVETALLPDGHVALRDGANTQGPTLIFTPEEWKAFVLGARDGEFDPPE